MAVHKTHREKKKNCGTVAESQSRRVAVVPCRATCRSWPDLWWPSQHLRPVGANEGHGEISQKLAVATDLIFGLRNLFETRPEFSAFCEFFWCVSCVVRKICFFLNQLWLKFRRCFWCCWCGLWRAYLIVWSQSILLGSSGAFCFFKSL